MTEILFTFLGALALSIIGYTPPGMMNMTMMKIALENSHKHALQFMMGTVTVLMIQAMIATVFNDYLVENPDIVMYLKKAAPFVLLALSIMFFFMARKENFSVGITDGNFWSGFKMSALNLAAIPFFLFGSTYFKAEKWMGDSIANDISFIIGVGLGCFIIFRIYILFSAFINKRVGFIAKNINYVLMGLFLLLSLLGFYNFYL